MQEKSTPNWALYAKSLFATWVVVALTYLFYGTYNLDEGFYSLISREVWHGRALYSDIRYTQMPLLPYVYGLFLNFLPPRIESGRFISLIFSLIGFWAIWKLLVRRYGEPAALVGLLVVMVNNALLNHFMTVRTPALTFCIAALSLLALSSFDYAEENQRIKLAALAGVLAGLAVLTRLSLLPLAVLIPLYFMKERRAALVCALGSLGTLLAVGTYYGLTAGDRFYFGILGFHQLYAEQLNAGMDETMSGFWRNSFPDGALWLAVIVLACVALWHTRNRWKEHRFEIGICVAWLIITLIHFTRQPAYATYQTPIVWAPAILAAWLTSKLLALKIAPQMIASGAFFLCLALLPVQGYSLDFMGNTKPAAVAEAARQLVSAQAGIEAKTKRAAVLVTLDPGIAFCAPSLSTPQGYEMSEFAFIPVLPPRQQEYFRGLAEHRIAEDARKADLLAFTARHLGMLDADVSEKIAPILPETMINEYGQFGVTGDSLYLGLRTTPKKRMARKDNH